MKQGARTNLFGLHRFQTSAFQHNYNRAPLLSHLLFSVHWFGHLLSVRGTNEDGQETNGDGQRRIAFQQNTPHVFPQDWDSYRDENDGFREQTGVIIIQLEMEKLSNRSAIDHLRNRYVDGILNGAHHPPRAGDTQRDTETIRKTGGRDIRVRHL